MSLREMALLALLAVAVFTDVRSRRIPNALVVLGMCFGLGSANAVGGGAGALDSLAGGIAGLAVFLPLYALRWLGAGDVKLLAMIGTFVGLPDVMWISLYTALFGGLLGIATMALSSPRGRFVIGALGEVVSRILRRSISGTNSWPGTRIESEAPPGRAKLPYAVALCLGTLAWLGPHL